jgi:hypothetical protein
LLIEQVKAAVESHVPIVVAVLDENVARWQTRVAREEGAA